MTIRVMVVDDQALIRGGLLALLAAAPGFEPVGEAVDGHEAVKLAVLVRPDVVLMDIRMPMMDGIDAARQILAPDADEDDVRPRVIVLTTFDRDEYVYTALSAGAAGFLLKDTPPDRILAAIEAVVAGDVLVSPRITQRLVEAYAQQRQAPSGAGERLDELTPREVEVDRHDPRQTGDGQAHAVEPRPGRRRRLRERADHSRRYAAFMTASSNKCLQGVPGPGFVIAQEDALVRTAGHAPALTLDLHDQWRTLERTQATSAPLTSHFS